MTDIFSLKVEEIVSKIKDAQLTSVEVCQKYIERINKFEKDVKAWAHFDKKLLLEKAEEADQHRRSGKPTGPLHGIPIALKDIIGTVDMPTECGTPIRKGKSYSQNAEIVDLLLSAGAIVMGKTATSELAYLGPSKTTNPHDHSRTPGGSSSGSAASVGAFNSYEEVFEDYHGVLTPSSPGVAPKGLKSTGTAEFNKVWSYLGTPCISLPLLQGENNMPLGVQLVGARYDDHRFLGVANWLEKECNK